MERRTDPNKRACLPFQEAKHQSVLLRTKPRPQFPLSNFRGALTPLIALDDVVQEFRYRFDSGNQQMIPRAGAGDVQQVALGVIHFL
jgi:hypothetical protein